MKMFPRHIPRFPLLIVFIDWLLYTHFFPWHNSP